MVPSASACKCTPLNETKGSRWHTFTMNEVKISYRCAFNQAHLANQEQMVGEYLCKSSANMTFLTFKTHQWTPNTRWYWGRDTWTPCIIVIYLYGDLWKSTGLVHQSPAELHPSEGGCITFVWKREQWRSRERRPTPLSLVRLVSSCSQSIVSRRWESRRSKTSSSTVSLQICECNWCLATVSTVKVLKIQKTAQGTCINHNPWYLNDL